MVRFLVTDAQRAQIAENYFARWDKDDLSDAIIGNSPGEQPLRSFRSFVMTVWQVEQNWHEDRTYVRPTRADPLDLARCSFLQFLSRPVWIAGRPTTVEANAYANLCLPTTQNSAWDVLSRDSTVDLDKLRAAIGSGTLVDELAASLWQTTLKRYANRALLTWFVVQRDSAGWLRYFERSFSLNDHCSQVTDAHPPRRKTFKASAGVVELRLNRICHDHDGVNVYEWEARLNSECGVLQAVANGSVYIRKRGAGYIDLDALFYVADDASDHDAAMVYELDKPGGPMEFDGPCGDLLFVWNWERLPHAPSGSGSECLLAALRSLKNSYKGIYHLVFDARPGQFASWSDHREHPQVALARSAAVKRVGQLISSIAPSAFPEHELTLVYPTIDEHPLGVSREIGRRGAQAMLSGKGHWGGISDFSDMALKD